MTTIFKLIIEDDEGKTTVYPLTDGSVSIGRKEGNTIRLMERNVSRRHARLLKNNGAVFIEDLDSYNGIRINGERIAGRYEVKEGDLVEIGDYHLALQRAEIEAKQAAAAAQRDGWPQPGTMPDIRLPNEMVQTAVERSNRDTVIDQPVPPDVPGAMAATVERGGLDQPLPPSQPLVKPPPRGDTGNGGSLPPFPGPGGLAPPKSPLYGESSQATEAAPSPSEGKLAVGPTYTSSVPRLICVSTSYAGKEFALTRPELIIGRVEDNDVVIEHRSVSRNHAKILFDGRTHKIIDLQSANGILVNGEEYAMTDLRKGDLIELGHVRFRFLPADEPFEATAEEAREMREAGVEPPSPPADAPANGDFVAGLVAPSAPAAAPAAEPALPAYDPSTAATVTDTPLDALGMGDLGVPSIDTEPASPPPPAARSGDDERATLVGARPNKPKASVAAYAATVPDMAAPEEPPPPRAQTRTESEVEVPPDGPKKGLLVVIGALLVTALVLGLLVVFGDGPSRKEALEEAFAAQDWARVVQIYEEDPTDFDKPNVVLPLVEAARAKLEKAPDKAPPPPSSQNELPPGDADAPATADTDPEPLEPVREPEPEMDLPAGDADARELTNTRRAKPKPKRKPKPKPKPTANTKDLANRGNRLLMQGDLSGAEKLLRKCIDVNPREASCHRSLGVLYAQRDDPDRSIRHYRKYVQLRPNAADADRVRNMIEAAQKTMPGGSK